MNSELLKALNQKSLPKAFEVAQNFGLQIDKKEDFVEILPLVRCAKHPYFASKIVEWELLDKTCSGRFGEVHGLEAFSKSLSHVKNWYLSKHDKKDAIFISCAEEDVGLISFPLSDEGFRLLSQKDVDGEFFFKKERKRAKFDALNRKLCPLNYLVLELNLIKNSADGTSRLHECFFKDVNLSKEFIQAFLFEDGKLINPIRAYFWGNAALDQKWFCRFNSFLGNGLVTRQQAAEIFSGLFSEYPKYGISVFQQEKEEAIGKIWDAIENNKEIDWGRVENVSPSFIEKSKKSDLGLSFLKKKSVLAELVSDVASKIERKKILFESGGGEDVKKVPKVKL